MGIYAQYASQNDQSINFPLKNLLSQHKIHIPLFHCMSIADSKIHSIESSKLNSLESTFDPNSVPVPLSIKKVITDLIDVRIGELQKNKGFLKRLDQTTDKIFALNNLKTCINESDCNATNLKELISQWEKLNSINESRSRISIFKTITTTQKMVDDIKETLDESKKLGR